MNDVILIGYSGHAVVIADILLRGGIKLKGYMEPSPVNNNTFNLEYLGYEMDTALLKIYKEYDFFVSIGSNQKRKLIMAHLENHGSKVVNAIDPSALISVYAQLEGAGVMAGGNVCINARTLIGKGAICNTAAVIEHDCIIGNFAHIGPAAVLCGNVRVGECAFIGAGTVIKEGIIVGDNAIIGAGSTVIRNVPDNCKVAGNPAKMI